MSKHPRGERERRRADAALKLQEAGAHLEAGRYAQALPLLQACAPALHSPAALAALAQCLLQLGRGEEAQASLEQSRRDFASDPDLALLHGSLLLEAGRFGPALAALTLARQGRQDDVALRQTLAYAALQAGAWADAEAEARAAQRLAGGPEAAMLLGLALAAQARFAEAIAALDVAGSTPETQALAARLHLRHGSVERAQALYLGLEAAGALPDESLADPARAAQRLSAAPEGPARALAQTQLALLGDRPREALPALAALLARTDLDEEDRQLAQVLQVRALRLGGQPADAEAARLRLPPGLPGPLQALAAMEEGHLRAHDGDFERARAAFDRAVALAPALAEATQAAARAREGLRWKDGLLESAAREVKAAQAEAEALRHTFAAHAQELAALKRQLAELERQRQHAERGRSEAEAAAAEAAAEAEAAHAQAEVEAASRVRAELEAREQEARQKALDAVSEAFSGRAAEAPGPVREGLFVAEHTYQKALQTDLPGAGIAVLYAGALERALNQCLVLPFERHLTTSGQREAFLAGARRAGAGGRREYSDHFVGAFDREQPLRAPSLGEIARVLRKRSDAHLGILQRFWEGELGHDAAWLDQLARFVEESKTQLRDPVAHGRVLEITDKQVAAFRRALMQSFEGGRGVLARLAFPR
jgi:Skp family chaperone for outer membrane proteins/Flp pilus assembly protein TadD